MNTLLVITSIGALIASLNPCTLSVMIMAISSLLGKSKHPRHTGSYVGLFSVGIFLSYTIIGLLSTLILANLPVGLVGYIGILLALILVIFGVFEIKDYFWYGRGWSFKRSARTESVIHDWTKKHHSKRRGFLLGIYTSLRLSHYTLVMIFAYAVLFVLASPYYLSMPIIWALWYIAPLVILSLFVASGLNVHSFLAWKEETKHIMRLSIGLLYVALGWTMLVYLAGGLHIA